MKPKISIVVPTQRIGGLDVLLSSLEQQTFKDFELILSDALHFYRAEEIRKRAANFSFPVKHVEPFGNQFPIHSYCRSVNTGIAHARGDVVLITCDHAWLDPQVLETHAEKTAPGRATLTPYKIVTAPPLKKMQRIYGPGDDTLNPSSAQLETWMNTYCTDLMDGQLKDLMWSILQTEITPGTRVDFPVEHIHPVDSQQEDMQVGHLNCTLKCDSFALSDLLSVNGLNEAMDGSQPFQDSELANRLKVLNKVSRWEVGKKGVYVQLPQIHKFLFLRKTLRDTANNQERYRHFSATLHSEPVNRWNLRERHAEIALQASAGAENDLPSGWVVRTSELHGKPFKFVCNEKGAFDASWYCFEDEQSVRELWWKIKPGDVVVDAGTAYGSYALSALAQGADKVFCWSPEFEEFDLLRASAEANGWSRKLYARRDGLWSEPGALIAYSFERPSTYFKTLEEAQAEASKYVKVKDEQIPQPFIVSTIDTVVMNEHRVTRVDWLKLDVEGAEVEVLKGADKLLKQFHPNVLVENHLFKDPTLKDQVATHLEKYGYREIGTVPYHSISHSLYVHGHGQAELAVRPTKGREKKKLAFVLDPWFVPIPIDPITLLEDPRGLTGSESSIFGYATEMLSRGHDVEVFTRTSREGTVSSGLKCSSYESFERRAKEPWDAVLSWMHPKSLQLVRPGTLRVLNQQVNDFGYCPGWEEYVDIVTSPSKTHRTKLKTMTSFTGAWEILPNGYDSIFLERAQGKSISLMGGKKTNSKEILHASSPDRGLHLLLEAFPEIKRRVPEATLTVYYRWDTMYEALKDHPSENTVLGEIANRVRYIHEAMLRLAHLGVRHEKSVSRRKMAEVMSQARILGYPCDPTSFTEGFSVTTLEAAVSGCVPVIIGADALSEIYSDYCPVIPAPYSQNKQAFIDKIVELLSDDTALDAARKRAEGLKTKYSWTTLGDTLERLLKCV